MEICGILHLVACHTIWASAEFLVEARYYVVFIASFDPVWVLVSRLQKGKTNLDFTEAKDSEWQWHQLGHMHICTSPQTNNHTGTPALGYWWRERLAVTVVCYNAVEQVVALYKYQPQNPDELSLEKGCVINVISKLDSDWWTGELNGQTGLFPSNYVAPLSSVIESDQSTTTLTCESLVLYSICTGFECSLVHKWMLVFLRGCFLPCLGRTDGSVVIFNSFEPCVI